MSLEKFMPGGVKIRCSSCGQVIKGTVRRLTTKKCKDEPLCHVCFGKRLGIKKEKKEEMKNEFRN